MLKFNPEQIVAKILKDWPETRNDDIALILMVWKWQGLDLTENQIALIKKCLHPETITRIRRKIQAEGLFKGDKFRQAQRTFFRTRMRQNFREEKQGLEK